MGFSRIDETGQRYGRLIVISAADRIHDERAAWLCRCDCGNRVVTSGKHLRSGNTKSCGCLRHDTRPNLTHGFTSGDRHPLYHIWQIMHERCRNPQVTSYPRYGGRGIHVCRRWSGPSGFPNFLADMGERPTPRHSIDRRDNDGHYEPSNCRWATRAEQAVNRHHATSLTAADVMAIRSRVASGELQRHLGIEYGVAQTTISAIVLRKTWRHVA